ncbi:uncharacterized protein At1g01500-like [Ipomoea triloba]|uniref:uncharacterized protein At1g01500-like n=1 Tax=Ipomoea triloba TaxID=35885 RepID=UPI00125DFA31|nr:uncharacterized protein At1g01500-like [Ipomoea triloba]
MDKLDEEVSRIYKGSNFTGGCLEIRLFYVRIAPCTVDAVPNHLILRHLRREMGVWLEMNGSRLPSSDAASITLRLDRADKDSSEVTYVSTDNVRVSGPVEFEVQEMKDVLILCGSLERVETPWNNGNGSENSSRTGWSMDCYTAASLVSGGSSFCNPKLGFCSPSIEVYIAGCCSGVPVILTKTIQVSPRKKVLRQGMLDAIPEDEEIWKDQRSVNGLVLQRKTPIAEADMDDYGLDEKAVHGSYYDGMYPGEDGQLSWFNAGLRVGVGIGLGMCVGVGIGVGLLMRSYQATTRNLRRRFF